jgi:hypothetical protein
VSAAQRLERGGDVPATASDEYSVSRDGTGSGSKSKAGAETKAGAGTATGTAQSREVVSVG